MKKRRNTLGRGKGNGMEEENNNNSDSGDESEGGCKDSKRGGNDDDDSMAEEKDNPFEVSNDELVHVNYFPKRLSLLEYPMYIFRKSFQKKL